MQHVPHQSQPSGWEPIFMAEDSAGTASTPKTGHTESRQSGRARGGHAADTEADLRSAVRWPPSVQAGKVIRRRGTIRLSVATYCANATRENRAPRRSGS